MVQLLFQFVTKVGIVMRVKYLELHGIQLTIWQRFVLLVTNVLLVLRQHVAEITKINKAKLLARHVLQAISAQLLK
jgi:hypothetical protein